MAVATITEHLREHALSEAGAYFGPRHPSLEEMRERQWCDEFEQLMRNRLIMGTFRYGGIWHDTIHWRKYVESIQRRIASFAETGNREHLVDVANLAMCLWCKDDHPRGHFHSADDIHAGERD